MLQNQGQLSVAVGFQAVVTMQTGPEGPWIQPNQSPWEKRSSLLYSLLQMPTLQTLGRGLLTDSRQIWIRYRETSWAWSVPHPPQKGSTIPQHPEIILPHQPENMLCQLPKPSQMHSNPGSQTKATQTITSAITTTTIWTAWPMTFTRPSISPRPLTACPTTRTWTTSTTRTWTTSKTRTWTTSTTVTWTTWTTTRPVASSGSPMLRTTTKGPTRCGVRGPTTSRTTATTECLTTSEAQYCLSFLYFSNLNIPGLVYQLSCSDML